MSFNLQTVDKSQQKTNKIIFLYSMLHVIVIGHLLRNSFAFALPRAACHPSVIQLSIFLINPR